MQNTIHDTPDRLLAAARYGRRTLEAVSQPRSGLSTAEVEAKHRAASAVCEQYRAARDERDALRCRRNRELSALHGVLASPEALASIATLETSIAARDAELSARRAAYESAIKSADELAAELRVRSGLHGWAPNYLLLVVYAPGPALVPLGVRESPRRHDGRTLPIVEACQQVYLRSCTRD